MAIQDPSPEAHLTVAAVARRIGVAPATLRTWDRRYGVGPSEHSEGEHRRYSEADLARLTHMRKLIVAGVPTLEASRQALALKATAGSKKFSKGHSSALELLETADESELVEQLLRAAKSLDRELLEAGLRNYLAKNSVESTWHFVMCPLLTKVGDQWKKSGDGIEVEHLLSDLIIRILISRVAQPAPAKNEKAILIASIGEETHSLAITALAAALADRGIAFQFLGARTPQSALNEVVRCSAPPAIFLWAQLKKHADPSFITELPALRPKPRIIVGGPGWASVDLAGADLAGDLTEACGLIERALGL